EPTRRHGRGSGAVDSAVDQNLVFEPRVLPDRIDDLAPSLAFMERKGQQLHGGIERTRRLAVERSAAQVAFAVDLVDPLPAAAGVGMAKADSRYTTRHLNNLGIKLRHDAPAQVVSDPISPMIADGQLRCGDALAGRRRSNAA